MTRQGRVTIGHRAAYHLVIVKTGASTVSEAPSLVGGTKGFSLSDSRTRKTPQVRKAFQGD